MKKEISISGLYYRYKKTSDADIKKHLADIKIVKEERNSLGSSLGLFQLNKKAMKKILEKPRGVSLTFDAIEIEDEPIKGLKKYKDVTYLVKSSSRFFLKPDIGEIFDQIDYHDLSGNKIKAICFKDGHKLLDETDGEHFLMTATLLTDKKSKL